MNYRSLTVTVLLLALTVIPASLQAYEDDSKPAKFGLRLAAFTPTDGNLRDIGTLWIGPGLDYYLKLDEDGRPLQYLSLALISTDDSDFAQAAMVPLTYTRLHRVPISDNRSKYTGYGIGLYKLDLELGSVVNETAYRPRLNLMYGQEFRDNYFAEIRAEILPEWNNTSWSGIFLNIGTRTSF